LKLDEKKLSTYLNEIEVEDGILILPDALIDELNQYERIEYIPDRFVRPTLHKHLKFIEREGTGRCVVVAVERIAKGDVVCRADGSRLDKPFQYTWQIDDHLHLMGPGALDHSCKDPNCIIDPLSNQFLAARDIQVGEMVTFNYLTTEYEVQSPFQCICGSDKCYKSIKGFRYLSQSEKKELASALPIAHYLNKYL
jgi:hypothetical protein